MHYRRCVRVGIAVAILATAATDRALAQSEALTIKRGTFTFEGEAGGGGMLLESNRGFRLGVGTGNGRFDLYTQCQVPECPPGAVVSLDAFWGGTDLAGTAEYRGVTYEDVGGLSSDSAASAAFSGSVTMPAMSDAPVSVTVPFEFAGLFAYGLTSPTGMQQVLLVGGGTVTITLRPNAERTSWELERAVFQFAR